MTLHSPDLFGDDLPAGFDGQFHWEYLIPSFQKATGRHITPMDIDAHVEINGQHLVIETKHVGAEVPKGQVLALAQLWAKGYHMVIFLWGKIDPVEYCVWYPSGKKTPWPKVAEMVNKTKEQPGTKAELIDICFRWAKWANGKPCPFQYDGRLDDGP